jgi:opacity protein-like surface antigen
MSSIRPGRWGATAGVILLLAGSAQGQYAPSPIGSREIAFRPFRVSFGTSSGYDSTTPVFTKGRQDTQDSSAYAGFTASGAMNLTFPDSFLGSRMSTGYTYYFTREQDQYDTPINIDSTFSHIFSPRWNMTINHNFQLEEEQQIGTGSALPNTGQQFRQQGDYIVSSLSINNGFLLAPRLTLNVGASYSFTRYENDFAANVRDEDNYGFNIGPSYQLTSQTTVGFGFGFSRNEHPNKTKIFAPSPPAPVGNIVVERVDRNTTSESFSFNISHAFTSRLRASASIGLQLTSFQNESGRAESVNPTFSGSVGYAIDPRSTISLSYVHNISSTDLADFTASIQDVLSAGYSRQINPKMSLTINATYSRSELDQKFRTTSSAQFENRGTEQAIGGSILVSYALANNLGLSLGYSYLNFDSTFADQSYDQDRMIFNVRYSF